MPHPQRRSLNGPARVHRDARYTLVAAATLAALHAGAFAQETAVAPDAAASAPDQPATGASLGEVVITANRRSERLRNVPMAVDVVTAKDVNRYQLLDAKDIQKVAPGLEMTNNDGRQNVAAMRGVSYNPDTGVAVAAVGVYVNEVPVSANVAFNAMYDLGQIEVLRGPQGTLRGQMTPAGAITMGTRRPDLSALGGEVQTTLDNRGGRNVRGAFNLPLIADRLAVRFAAVNDRNRGNQVTDITNGDRSRNDTESYRLSVAFQATDDLRFDLMTQHLNVDSLINKQLVGDGVVTPFNLGRAPRTLAVEDLASVTDRSGSYITNADLTTLKAVWQLGAHHTVSVLGSQQDFKLLQGFDRDVGNVLPGISVWQQGNIRSKVDTAEVVLNSNGLPFWNYTFGLYYEHNTSTTAVDVASGAVTLDIPGNSTTKAAFTRQSFKLSDTLTFDAGLRYSQITADRQSTVTVATPFGPFSLPPSIPDVYAHVVDKPVTWGLSLSNRFGNDVTGYAAFAHSFRPGTYQVGIFNPVDPNLLAMKPEKSDSFELGLKSDLLNRKLSLNVATFVQKYKGFIDYVPNAAYQYVDPQTGATQRDNSPFNSSGNATLYGIEAQATARPSSVWDINVGTSWVRSKYTSGQAPCTDSNGDGVPDAAGASLIPSGQQVALCPLKGRISEMPRFSLSSGTEYRFRYGDLRPYVGALVNYRPGFHSTKVGYDYAAFTNISLFTGLRSSDGNWEVGLFVKNLLDQRKVTSTTTTNEQTPAGALGLFDSGYRTVVVTPPRQIGVTARYAF